MSEDYARGPCPRCGAVTLKEAETKCRPSQTEDGEYFCEVGDEEGRDYDGEGFILQPTQAFYDKLDAWVDAELARGAHLPEVEP